MTGDLINVLTDLLEEIKPSAVLNSWHFKCSNVSTGIPQGLILEPLI